jgi:CheY-like chemotaxis protein
LVTDIRLLPGKLKMTGWDVAHRARELNPELAIIYMTGDSGVDWSSKGVPKSVLVTKPFAPAQIISAVSQLLNASG